MRELLFLNGKPLGKELPLRSLFYGEGVFETFRWKGGPPVFLEKHLTRMKKGAELLDVPFPGEEAVRGAIEGAVGESGAEDAYVKVCLLSAGPLKFYERASEGRILVVVKDYEQPKERAGVHVASFRRSSSSPILAAKSISYLENVLARREAESMGFDEAIFLNEEGFVTEGSSTNIFWANEGILYTPAPECGLLPGVTREALISLAPELGLRVKEGKFRLSDVLSSQGAFLTNSLAGIMAIVMVDGVKMAVDDSLFNGLKLALFKKLRWL